MQNRIFKNLLLNLRLEMAYHSSTKMAFLMLFTFLISVFSFLMFSKSFLNTKVSLLDRQEGRFDLFFKYFSNEEDKLKTMLQFKEGKPRQFKQVVWMLVDDWPDFTLKMRPNSSKKTKYYESYELFKHYDHIERLPKD